MTIEVVVYNIDSALKAAVGGADRIELCDNPGEGGTTPSAGTIEVVRQNVSIDVYVMIRPRGGDFHYSNYEFFAMKRDVTLCQRLSVDGIVTGILTTEGKIDKKRCKEIIDRARPLKVTCHRAFDMTRDPIEALEDCIEVGFDRILTSGHQKQAHLGKALIADLVARAGNRIKIMAGSGVNSQNVAALVSDTNVREIHFSATAFNESPMAFHNTNISGMGSTNDSEYKIRTVDADIVRNIRRLAEAAVKL